MADRRPLVNVDGTESELPLGDRLGGFLPAIANGQPATFEQLGGGATIHTIEIDFGSIPIYSKTTTFTHAGATVGQKVLIGVSANMPVGVDLDELEMDSIFVAARVSAVGTIEVIAVASSRISGKRNFNYQVV